MLSWLAANLINILVSALIVLVVALAIRSLVRDKKAGKNSCGGNCGSCGVCGCGSCQVSPKKG